MTIEELFSVQADSNQLSSLYLELARHEDFNPYKGNVITDMPTGSTGRNFLEWHAEEGERIRHEIDLCKEKLQKDRVIVDQYIQDAPYPECDIIRFRAINNMSWEDIGAAIGYSRRWVSIRFWQYLKEDRKYRKYRREV